MNPRADFHVYAASVEHNETPAWVGMYVPNDFVAGHSFVDMNSTVYLRRLAAALLDEADRREREMGGASK